MTTTKLIAYLRKDRPEPCCEGHYDCASHEGGPCSNACWSLLFERAGEGDEDAKQFLDEEG